MIAAPPSLRPALIGLTLAAIITSIPAVDLWLISVFYDPATGTFPGIGNPVLDAIRRNGPPALWIGVIFLLGATISRRIAWRSFGFVASSLIIGPGLIVNGILKEIWGRARPREIMEFGGEASFSMAWVPTDMCASNCSFSSGHAAFFFWLAVLAFIAPKRSRTTVFWSGIAAGLVMGILRMIQGGHFASDILWSGVIVLGMTALLRRLFKLARNETL